MMATFSRILKTELDLFECFRILNPNDTIRIFLSICLSSAVRLSVYWQIYSFIIYLLLLSQLYVLNCNKKIKQCVINQTNSSLWQP